MKNDVVCVSLYLCQRSRGRMSCLLFVGGRSTPGAVSDLSPEPVVPPICCMTFVSYIISSARARVLVQKELEIVVLVCSTHFYFSFVLFNVFGWVSALWRCSLV